MFERSIYKKFELGNSGITYKDEYHDFSDIKHLHFERVVTTERVNFVKVGEPERAILKIELLNGVIIKIKFSESTMFVGFNLDKKHDIKNLLQLYIELSEKTFEYRLKQYINQITMEGFFIYDKCRFFPNSKIVIKNVGYVIEDCNFLKSPGYITVKKKNPTIMNKMPLSI